MYICVCLCVCVCVCARARVLIEKMLHRKNIKTLNLLEKNTRGLKDLYRSLKWTKFSRQTATCIVLQCCIVGPRPFSKQRRVVWLLIAVLCVSFQVHLILAHFAGWLIRFIRPYPGPLPPHADLTLSVKAEYWHYLSLGLNSQRPHILFTECNLETSKILLFKGQNVFRDLRLRGKFL